MRSTYYLSFLISIAFVAAMLWACGEDSGNGTEPSTPTTEAPAAELPSPDVSLTTPADGEVSEYIGTATMSADGTITLRLTATLPDGSVGEGVLEYAPGDPDYQMILDHIGGIEPGEEKPVRPFPE